MSMSIARLVIIDKTAVSNNPKNTVAVKYVKHPTTMHGPKIDEISSESFVIVFIMKSNEKTFPTVIPTLPRKMKTLAMRLANENFMMCLTLSKNPFHADLMKFSPETAMYAYADSLM